ncbi:hypothetical protein BVC80_1001g11 [Macleaya cordata]|uniref:Patatin/Phospholipase A2-related n=1 Tax=Macleaya cordata TaxID=56857 RepID=A0A200QIS3_MACCD|nr:hypothetical protein BVC80_1001g11 [Macleaya cordata]
MHFYQTCVSVHQLPPHIFRLITSKPKTPKTKYSGVSTSSTVELQPTTQSTLVAMNQVTKEIFAKNEEFQHIKNMDCTKYLVISLGTGSAKQENKYSAAMASKWGRLHWLYNGANMPLMAFIQASGDMVDIHASVLFQALHSEKNYLRIEADDLEGNAASVDISTEENMKKLIQIGQELLKKRVSRVNLDKGVYEEVKGEGTNEEALIRFAKLLSDERKARQE